MRCFLHIYMKSKAADYKAEAVINGLPVTVEQFKEILKTLGHPMTKDEKRCWFGGFPMMTESWDHTNLEFNYFIEY